MSVFPRATRQQYSPEEKIRFVLNGLKGEDGIAELCRREGIAQSLHYSGSKEFLEAVEQKQEIDFDALTRIGGGDSG